jgi:glycosidase
MVWPELKYENETYATVTKFTDSDPVAFDHEIFAFYKKILHLRQRHPALRQGTITTLHKDDAAGVYAFRRDFENDAVIAVFNESVKSQMMLLKVVPEQGPRFREVLSGKEHNSRNAILQIDLAPRSAAIYEKIRD